MGLSFAVTEKRSFPVWGIFSGKCRQKSSKVGRFTFGPIWVYRLPSPRHGHFRSGVNFGVCRQSLQKQATLLLVGWVYRLTSLRYRHPRCGVTFGIFRQKSSKIGHLIFDPMSLSYAVTYKRRPFQLWCDGSTVYRSRGTVVSCLGNYSRTVVKSRPN
jgi:hypothetical protein